MPQTTQRFHSVSDSFHSRIDVWVFMMWPLWPSGSGHSGLCPPLPPPSGHKGHIIQPQTSILSWKLSLTSWKCWVVWVILLSNLLQPTRTIRMLPILSRNSSFRQKDPRKISFWIWSKFFKSQWKTFNLWFGKLAVKKLHQKRHKKWNKKLGQKLESFLNFFLFEAAWAFGKMCLVESWWYQKSRLWQGV